MGKTQRYKIAIRTLSSTAQEYIRRYQGLSKAQAAILVQARTGAIGLPAFLHQRGVPEANPECECGEIGTVRHYLAFCRLYAEQRHRLENDTGTSDAKAWLNGHPRKVAIWMLEHLPLMQFSWMRKHMGEMVRGRGEKGGEEGDEEIDPS